MLTHSYIDWLRVQLWADEKEKLNWHLDGFGPLPSFKSLNVIIMLLRATFCSTKSPHLLLFRILSLLVATDTTVLAQTLPHPPH